MAFKYHCDDCGKEIVGGNVAAQLDMTGKAYCWECRSKRLKRESTIYRIEAKNIDCLKWGR